MLMFLRTSDTCPELGTTPNEYWTSNNINACLSGAGVPITAGSPDRIRRDEAMQQLFALRRKSFAFQQLQTKPAGYVDPSDLSSITANRQGAMIAADRLKLLFRTKNNLLPASPLLREDAVLAVDRLVTWEQEGGQERETNDRITINKDVQVNHWRDLDTDIYVTQIKTSADTYLHPILPRRSFNPAKASSTQVVRNEFVYQTVSDLAKDSGALVAVNGSYFNVQWPWGALEDVAILHGKTLLDRTDRSTFVVCKDGKMFIGTYTTKNLQTLNCKPDQALGAGPLFMSKGNILTESTKEGFDEYTQWERRVGNNARTAVAVSKDRKTAYLIVVAGKSYPAFGRGGNSLGTFLQDKYPDISDAMMYDGGSSSELYAKGKVLVGMGVSGSSNERPVISALGVFSKKAEAQLQAQFKKDQIKYWDKGNVVVKVPKPDKAFAWQSVSKTTQIAGATIGMTGSRGSEIQVIDPEDGVKTIKLTFDKYAYDKDSRLTITRREGTHENGWRIPTEIHVFNPVDGSDIDIIKLLAYIPEAQRPDLKTLDAITFRKTGIVFGDASGRYWFYYAKDKQLSPATFIPKPAAKPIPAKKK